MVSIEIEIAERSHSWIARLHARSSTVRGMDAVAGLLDGPRARGAFLLRSTMDPPWSLRIEDEAPLTLVALVRGSACIVPDGGEPTWLRAGDVAITRGPDPYLVADHPDTPPQAVIIPGGECRTPDGRPVKLMDF